MLATEKVTRKTLDDADQRRLVEEALGELDFSSISAGAAREQLMEELAQVYARALFEVAREQGKLDVLREQLGAVRRRARAEPRARGVLLLAVLLDQEKQDALGRLLDGADEALPELPRAADREPPHARDLPHPRRVRAAVGEENKLLPVEITSAIELDEATTESLGKPIGERTGRKVTLAARVDPDILGGIVIRVGNSILDASIRNRLEHLRTQVAAGVR